MIEGVQATNRKVDGWVCNSIPEIEQEAMDHCANYMGRPVIGIG